MRSNWRILSPVAGALALSTLALGACAHSGGPDNPVTGVNPDGSPAWVRKGSGAFDGPQGKAFYGVGLVQGIDNPSLSRQTAGNRARGEIAKMFDSYVAAMMKDYQRSTTAGNFQASAEEQDVVSAQKTITEVTLRGVEVRDHWRDPQTGALYALAVLDLNAIEGALGNAQLSPKVRDYVRDNARKAFEDLDKELQKRSDPAPAPAAAAEPAAEEPAPAPAPVPAAAPARQGKIKVGLRITGVDRATVQTCFAERLTQAGFELYESSSDVDVMISGQLLYKKAGVNNNTFMVKAHANIRVMSMSDSRTLVAIAEKLKVGRPTLSQAVQLAVSRLCDRVAPMAVNTIQQKLR